LSIVALLALAEVTGSITVEVGNVRNSHGRVIVDICPQDRFLKDDCPYHGEAQAQAGETTVIVANVPAGRYAAQSFHDENGNSKVDQALFGIPKEGVGFSRNARIRLSPPKWRDAVFDHQARTEVIRFDLRYFMGAKGPGARSK
jgi:uncharacterized protein (DUF2141 family)